VTPDAHTGPQMTEPQDVDPEPAASASPYLRFSAPVVAGVLLVFLAALLAFGLYANANLRPPGVAVPTPVAAAAPATPTAAPVAQPTATLAVPTPTIEPTREPTPLAVIPSTATPEVTAVATALPPTATVTVRPTISPELETEIGDAYQTYWQVRAQALYDLDTTHLDEVMAGDHLSAIQDRINELRAEGRAIQTEVDHDYAVVDVSVNTARVADSYVDRSIYVDAETHNDLSTPTGQHVN